MAAKKKTEKKRARLKQTAGMKGRPTKKPVKKSTVSKKKSAKKKPTQKKVAVKTRIVGKKTIGSKAVSAPKKPVRGMSQTAASVAFSLERLRARSGGQSGDLQGLSRAESADSESVEELLEEGNAFEADVVAGVEEASNADEKEVRTHEVPEDDVPEEYLDRDE